MSRVLVVEGYPRPEFEQRLHNDSRFQRSAFAQPATFDYMMNEIQFGQKGAWAFDALAVDTEFLNGEYPNLKIPKPVSFYKAQRPEISKLPVIGLTSLEGGIVIPDGVDIVYSVHQHTILDILRNYIATRVKRS